MKVDFDSWQGHQLYEVELQALEEKRDFGLIEMLKPEFFQDGNMYCFTYPSREGLPNDCVQGFGETAARAAHDFRNNWYQRKAGLTPLVSKRAVQYGLDKLVKQVRDERA